MHNKKLKIGDNILGRVIEIAPYGAFIEGPNGERGLLHVSEISSKFIHDINAVLTINQTFTLKIIDIDQNNGYLRLSLKRYKEAKPLFKKPFRIKLDENEVDFTSLKQALPNWIEQTLKEMKE